VKALCGAAGAGLGMLPLGLCPGGACAACMGCVAMGATAGLAGLVIRLGREARPKPAEMGGES
jgi:hypothetical protein